MTLAKASVRMNWRTTIKSCKYKNSIVQKFRISGWLIQSADEQKWKGCLAIALVGCVWCDQLHLDCKCFSKCTLVCLEKYKTSSSFPLFPQFWTASVWTNARQSFIKDNSCEVEQRKIDSTLKVFFFRGKCAQRNVFFIDTSCCGSLNALEHRAAESGT